MTTPTLAARPKTSVVGTHSNKISKSSVKGTKKQPRFWLYLAPAMFLLAWGGNHFTPLLRVYEALGNYAPWQANFLLGTYVAGLIPGLLIAAALCDRYGRKPVMMFGIVLAVVGSLSLAFGLHTFWVLCVGRALAGIGVGVAMSVGTSWMKELSSAPYDLRAQVSAGARRPALTITLGFGIGAGVTGALAQWAPLPAVLPYLVHIALSVISILLLLRAPETLKPESRKTTSWWRDLRAPSARHTTFLRVVAPAAPWIFGAAAVAYAVVPAVVAPKLGDFSTIYAAALTILTLGVGAAVQPFVPRLNRLTGGRALVVGLVFLVVGMCGAVAAALTADPLIGVGVSITLGTAYGVCMVAGLMHVQSIASPHEIAGLTGLYYSLSYTGFLLPTVIAALLPLAPYAASLAGAALLCAGSLALVIRGYSHTTQA
ncbi:MFS transporter [Timonella sp. A28]|uniref:MFS transporter n=1 Tax=Timonella sp. A28 TaxID=3442640 RepID=UPI003EBC9EC0